MHSYVDARPSHVPRLDEGVTLADGRRLAYAEWGPEDGTPLLFFRGTPGSRLFCPDEQATNNARVRFIAFDRAGYGGSDFANLIGYPQFVPDVVELLDHLDVDRAVLVGWSGGGPHALAAAALASDRVASVGLASSGVNGPDLPLDRSLAALEGEAEWIALIHQIAENPVARRELAAQRCQWLIDDPTELVDLTERFAPEVLSAPGMRDAMQALFVEAVRPGIDGYVNDYVTFFAAESGFNLAEVRAPVAMWYGEQDRNLRPAVSLATADRIPDCTVSACHECGHFTPIAHWPEILERLL